jgi:hypothetical protein
MNKVIVLLIFIVAVHTVVSGQIRMEGRITGKNLSGETEPLPFTPVVLFNMQDSSKIEYTSMTDLEGNYLFENLVPQKYRLSISCLGYESLDKEIRISPPSVGTTLTTDFELEVNEKMLNEVVVTASAVNRYADKSSYLISAADIKHARFSMDLLEKIPDLSIDPINQKVVSAKGSVKLLINGVSASEIELRAIPAGKILRMDYYDIPPARYMGYGSVVNVITKTMDEGFSAGTTLQQALTTGFANDDLFLKYNHGKHQYSVDYLLNYRNYRDMKQETAYAYLFDDKQENRNEKTDNRFGYDDHFINLKYLHQVPENHVFQFRVSPNFSRRHSEDVSTIDLNGHYRHGLKTDKSKITNPVLNAYYWKQLANQQELTVDVVGTLFSTRQDKLNREFSDDNSLQLEDKMRLDNSKKSFIGELIYDKKIGMNKLSLGYKIETYRLFSKVENSFNNPDYRSSYLSNYAYGEFSGMKNKFLYRISVGMANRVSQSYDTRYSAWLFKPLLVGGYRINDLNTIRVLYTQSPEEPTLSDFSNNSIYVTDHIVKKGNPELKYSLIQAFALMYSYSHKALDFNLMAMCGETKNPINSYFLRTDSYLMQTTVNDLYSSEYGISYSLSVKPFSTDFLTLKLTGDVLTTRTNSLHYGQLSRLYAPFRYTVTFKYDAFLLSYQGNIVSKKLSGAFLVADENKSHITLRYTKENFSVSGNLFWAFTLSKYTTETTPESIVAYSNHRQIYDNANMFTLGLSYTFDSGKKYGEQDKRINNKDTDSGLFK